VLEHSQLIPPFHARHVLQERTLRLDLLNALLVHQESLTTIGTPRQHARTASPDITSMLISHRALPVPKDILITTALPVHHVNSAQQGSLLHLAKKPAFHALPGSTTEIPTLPQNVLTALQEAMLLEMAFSV
jgi:hypothetical protein